VKGVHFFLAAGQARRAVPSPRVAEKQAARRDHILDHAASIVLEDGLDALTMERLAQALGVATSALYRTFSGRAALLAGLQVRAIAALAAEVDAALTAAPRGGTPAVRALGRVLAALRPFAFAPERGAAWLPLVDASLSAPEATLDDAALAEVEAVLAPLLTRVTEAIEAAAQAGALAPGDAAVRTRVAWATLHGLHHLRRRDRVEPPARRSAVVVAAALDGLFLGWGAKPRAWAAARARAEGRARAARGRAA
jgi:AcrR family transcriptional regulator